MKHTAEQMRITAWSLSGIVVLLALIVWGQGFEWEFDKLDSYQLFPLFGLIAFSVMWSHYIASALRQYSGLERGVLKDYLRITGYVVLGAILLHPGLISWQLWRDGEGLPPGSEFSYVGDSLKVAVTLGMVALFMFLAYELHRWFARKSWWKYIQYLSDIAMFMIFIHALSLGGELEEGWFRGVWYFYGVTLVFALIYTYSQKLKHKAIAKS